jgi:hypothetical protein
MHNEIGEPVGDASRAVFFNIKRDIRHSWAYSKGLSGGIAPPDTWSESANAARRPT